jgi:HNH endonuclease
MIAQATVRTRRRRQERNVIKQAEREAKRQLHAEMKAAAARRRAHINDDGTKQCISCKESFAPTGVFFYMRKTGRLDSQCKSCRCPRGSARRISIDRVRELLHYDPATGQFMWRVKRTGRARKSGEAGSRMPNGRLLICIDQKSFIAHQLAFVLMEGRWPSKRVDHINLDCGDNRWCNLREGEKEDSKICNRCSEWKPFAEFPKTGRVCKACKKAYHTQWCEKAYARVCWKCGESKPPREMQQGQRRNICKSCFQARTEKRCRKCGKYKPLTRDFWQPEGQAADGFRNDCLDCRAARDAAKYEKQKSDPSYRERKAKNAKRWYAANRDYAQRRQKKYNAKPEVQQHRRERVAERRSTDPEFVEQNKRRSGEWYQANKSRLSGERRALRAAQRLANGDGRKRRFSGDRTVLKYATEIWQPRKRHTAKSEPVQPRQQEHDELLQKAAELEAKAEALRKEAESIRSRELAPVSSDTTLST